MELEKLSSFDICVRDDFNLVTLMLSRVKTARSDIIFERELIVWWSDDISYEGSC